ncbi:hypothetical protein L228DRAFT_271009 [Xylona heveae TC161]|uniref:Zn(2)-C6 fungal-type domain-containing protein n=1 Tax=Xylona heveae (strain CBS 132557 / TC161) TaxID=1328760 RepID=A0A164ZY74_XYLHT|nr:hypothetical protein L228DRAFT_271009 [Xylona heveae TC161]KZF19690.1 hypothetical protein L228DRAFT_271009 [Xylona heveae TC161]
MDRASGASPATAPQPSSATSGASKRRRSLSAEAPHQQPPAAKLARTPQNHVQINYLVRQYAEDLPWISTNDNMQTMLALISEYDGVLQRHESMAGNLGARPLGPILIKRFERLFDGPPQVLKCHGKEGTTVNWLDVVEFARNKPEQFSLSQMRDGVRVCQFYTKQCRVEISEEDYVLISSGMPQKLIPPQPIDEDEEKELGTLEALEKSLTQIFQLADQVSARARQLNHRLRNRKSAITSRRTGEASAKENIKPLTPFSANGFGQSLQRVTPAQPPQPEPHLHGFMPVNARRHSSVLGSGEEQGGIRLIGSRFDPARADSAAPNAELRNSSASRSRDSNVSQARIPNPIQTPPASIANGPTGSSAKAVFDTNDYATLLLNSASPAPLTRKSSTPSSQLKSLPDREEKDTVRAEMVARMEHLARGDRVIPPCDRCRRLHMDCLKNLTACIGCTKKHAKCCWKDVKEGELNGDTTSTGANDISQDNHRDTPRGSDAHESAHSENHPDDSTTVRVGRSSN